MKHEDKAALYKELNQLNKNQYEEHFKELGVPEAYEKGYSKQDLIDRAVSAIETIRDKQEAEKTASNEADLENGIVKPLPVETAPRFSKEDLEANIARMEKHLPLALPGHRSLVIKKIRDMKAALSKLV